MIFFCLTWTWWTSPSTRVGVQKANPQLRAAPQSCVGLHYDTPACWHLVRAMGLRNSSPYSWACTGKGGEMKQPSVGRRTSSPQEAIDVADPEPQVIPTALHLPLPAPWIESGPVTHGNSYSNRGFANWHNFPNCNTSPKFLVLVPSSLLPGHGHSPLPISSYAGLATTGFQEQRTLLIKLPS